MCFPCDSAKKTNIWLKDSVIKVVINKHHCCLVNTTVWHLHAKLGLLLALKLAGCYRKCALLAHYSWQYFLSMPRAVTLKTKAIRNSST